MKTWMLYDGEKIEGVNTVEAESKEDSVKRSDLILTGFRRIWWKSSLQKSLQAWLMLSISAMETERTHKAKKEPLRFFFC